MFNAFEPQTDRIGNKQKLKGHFHARKRSQNTFKKKYITNLIQTQGLNKSLKRQLKYPLQNSINLNRTNAFEYTRINQHELNPNKQQKLPNEFTLLSKCRSNINKIHALNRLLKQSKQQPLFQIKDQNSKIKTIRFIQKINNGTFGSVFKARFLQTGKLIAIKKIYFDSKHYQREEQICRMLKNIFIVRIIGIYHNEEHSQTQLQQIKCQRNSLDQNQRVMKVIKQEVKQKKIDNKKFDNKFFWNYTEVNTTSIGNKVCNIIMDLYDCDLSQYIDLNTQIDPLSLKLFSYQILRGILYLHSKNICHRDIKPKNILIKRHKVVISDFGSAKIFTKTKTANVSYICSRYYRAPELIFGEKYYDTSIDIWAIGCVFAQMILKKPIFCGSSSLDQLVSILRILGTPTWRNLSFAKQNVPKLPWMQGKGLKNVLYEKTSQNFIDLIEKMLVINPLRRINAAQALSHPYFDELRDQIRFGEINKEFQIKHFLKFNRGKIQIVLEQLKRSEHFKNRLIPLWFRQQQGLFKFKCNDQNKEVNKI